MRPDTCEWCCPNCCCSFGGRAETGSSPPVPACGNGMVRLWKAMVTHTRHPDVHLPSTEYDQYLHKYHPAPAKGMFLDLTNFGKGCCSADGKNEFSLSANGNFILKFVFPDASQLFDAESVTQQEGSVLAAERPCPLLKTTSSFPHGRHHSSRCFAAVGPLVCPLQPSPPLWSAPVAGALSPCPLNPFSAHFAASLPFTNPSTNKDALPASLENWERRAHEGCWKSILVLLHMLSSPSSANPSPFAIYLSTCQSTTLKYFWLYINLVCFMT